MHLHHLERLSVLAAVAMTSLICCPQSAMCAAPPEAIPGLLDFESPRRFGTPDGWRVWPAGSAVTDSTIAHGGRFAARIDRPPSGPGEFTAFSHSIPVTFTGDTLELRGWLRMDTVEGYAGLWLREDGIGGAVQFDNMESRQLTGTRDWAQYRVTLPLDTKARNVVIGALLTGTGTVWADDLELRVDGVPFTEAPAIVKEPTAIDTDHEFDAGSGIVSPAKALSSEQVQSLALLGKVWGFVKYHHPKVTAARVHWDYELFRVLPALVGDAGNTGNAGDRAAALRTISEWLNRLGEPDPCEPCAQIPDEAHLRPPVEWIHDRLLLGDDLSARLERIYINRDADGEQHYVRFAVVANPDFANEPAYPDSTYPDAGYRLLAVYRFWNIIEYWFPYRDLIPEDWDGVLAEFIPRVLAASDADEYRLVLMALIARVRDTHANLWSSLDVRPPRGDCILPIHLRRVEDRFVVGGYSRPEIGPQCGLQIGDEILAIDGVPVDSIVASCRSFYGASNDAARLRDIARFLHQGPPGNCRLTVRRDPGGGGPIEIVSERIPRTDADLKRPTHDLPGETFRLLGPDVAYLKLSSVQAASAAEYVRSAAKAPCLVIDLRNYPSEFVPFALGQHLVADTTAFVRFTRGDPSNPGAFLWMDPISITPQEPFYPGLVVILVDENTQSQAEYTTMALRAAPRCLVAGSTTAGADGNVSRFALPGGVSGAISGIGVFYPDKRPTQQIGIVPDLVVRPTIDGIRHGRDEVLIAAVRKALGREVEIETGTQGAIR